MNLRTALLIATATLATAPALAEEDPLILNLNQACEEFGCTVLLNVERLRFRPDHRFAGEVPGEYVRDPMLALMGLWHDGTYVPGKIRYRLYYSTGNLMFSSLEDVQKHLHHENKLIRRAREAEQALAAYEQAEAEGNE